MLMPDEIPKKRRRRKKQPETSKPDAVVQAELPID